jgi:hypothetical protein
MRGDERRIVDAFAAWLEAGGWQVRREVDFCDLVASRKRETLYVEAKGRTAAIGLDVDTLYGQLLRRMPIARTPPRGSPSWCPARRRCGSSGSAGRPRVVADRPIRGRRARRGTRHR